MKGGSEKFVSNESWDAAAMMRNSFDDIRGLSIAAFKAPQPPRPNQSSNSLHVKPSLLIINIKRVLLL